MDFVDAKPSTSGKLRGRNHVTTAIVVDENMADPPIRKRKGSSFIRTPLDLNAKLYPMNGGKRGKVLIFNQIFENTKQYRKGTEMDVQRLKCTLPKLGFGMEDILQFDDFRCKEIERVAIELKVDEGLENSDCLMVFILTHGGNGDTLEAKDGSYQLYEFLNHFTPTALPSMAGKPKIFVVQACRGNKCDRGVLLQTTTNDADTDSVSSKPSTFSYPEFADFIIVKSSHHGHLSFRNKNGSWLIQELCNVIENCDLETSSILDILLDTNDAVSRRISKREDNRDGHDKKQISSFYSTMTKRLYFKKQHGSSFGQPLSNIASNFCPALAMIETDGNTVCGKFKQAASQDENSNVKRSTRAKRRKRQLI